MSATETPAGDRQATARRGAAPQGTAPACLPAGATVAAPDQRPLRKDAERNRLRILQAAAEVFTEKGLRATLDDVADRAGVGVGTVYRRFPDKEALVEALFTDRLDTVVGYAEQALAEPDPWTGLAFFLERAATVIGRDRVDQARTRMLPVVSAMVERAQATGQVRADLRPTDIPLTLFMLSATSEY